MKTHTKDTQENTTPRMASTSLDPARTAASHGRAGGDGIHARQDEEHQVQRRVLHGDEEVNGRDSGRGGQ